MLAGILTFLGGFAVLYFMVRTIRNNPEMLNKANMSKSLTTMGILALILIGTIGAIILFLRH